MSLRSLEREILQEAKKVTGNNKLRMKDILEWSTGEIIPQPGEKICRLPGMGVNIALAQ